MIQEIVFHDRDWKIILSAFLNVLKRNYISDWTNIIVVCFGHIFMFLKCSLIIISFELFRNKFNVSNSLKIPTPRYLIMSVTFLQHWRSLSTILSLLRNLEYIYLQYLILY